MYRRGFAQPGGANKQYGSNQEDLEFSEVSRRLHIVRTQIRILVLGCFLLQLNTHHFYQKTLYHMYAQSTYQLIAINCLLI